MTPLVSILLPAKDPGRFLKERLDSIHAQTLTDWELLIVDSHSTDGSMEVFQKLAAEDRRVTLYERPPGLYQAWNFALTQARGKYVYVATADDSMRPDALEKMSAALEANPECDLCDSLLKLIDAEGNAIRAFDEGYLPHERHLAYPLDRMHVRQRYSDFFVHLGGKTVYTSMTQILIRRTLFEKTGPFPENAGRFGDYAWGMRAALHADVIFVPEYLSTWRIHSGQTTFAADAARQDYPFMKRLMREILQEAPPEIAAEGKRVSRLALFKGLLSPAKENGCTFFQKLRVLGAAFLRMPDLTMEFLFTLPVAAWSVPRRFLFIDAFDRMIRRHTARFYRGRIKETAPVGR